jgi:enoyl-CoA hydratase/carnithine racemase
MSDPSVAEPVRRDENAGVLTITFTRDAKLNAVNPAMLDALSAAVADLAARDDLRVLVITAEGTYFTAGMDVKASGAHLGLLASDDMTGVEFRQHYRRLHQLFDEFEAVEKPVILAAQGPCLGVGVEMMVSCDFRFAAARATFGLPEITNLAVLPGSGGISRLTRIVGPAWARWIAMAAETVDADRALAMGLVHRVIPDDVFAPEVAAFARRLTGFSVEALGLAKLAIDAAADADRTTARNVDRIANTLLVLSAEHRAKLTQFPT